MSEVAAESNISETEQKKTDLEPSLDFNEDEDVIDRAEARIPEKQWNRTLAPKGYQLMDEYGLVSFSPEDPRLAKNWSLRKRIAHTVAYGVTTLSAQVCASVISPGARDVSQELGVGSEVATLAFSIYVLGNMVGPPIFGPLSEVYGRKVGIFIPTFLAGVCMLICANVQNIASLTVFRFIAGVFGAAPIVGAVGAMGDMWNPAVLNTAVVLYATCLVLGAVAAPVFGALLVTTGPYGWRWACYLAGLLAIVVSLFNFLALHETFLPVVEQSATRNTRLDTGYWALHAKHDKLALSLREFLTVHLARPIVMLITPIVLLMNIFSAFIYGLFFLIITSVGYEFQRVYHFTSVTSYLPLFGFFSGFCIGGAINIIVARRYIRIAKKLRGRPPPEERLMAMMIAGWLMPCGMFLYGWTMKSWIHWSVPCVGLGFVGAGFIVIFQNCLLYLVDCYFMYIASVIASNTILRSVFGGVFPLFAIQMYNGMGVHWASSLLGFVCLALCVAPFLFYIFGERLRNNDPFKKVIQG